MKYLRANLKSIIIIILVLLGLAVTLYLIKNPQVFKSRADVDALNITASDGSQVDKVDGKFRTTSDHIKIGIQDINRF